MDIKKAILGQEYIVKSIETDDSELDNFLFTLGCYSGEAITVVAKVNSGYAISVKNSRYNIDENLAEAIKLKKKFEQ